MHNLHMNALTNLHILMYITNACTLLLHKYSIVKQIETDSYTYQMQIPALHMHTCVCTQTLAF